MDRAQLWSGIRQGYIKVASQGGEASAFAIGQIEEWAQRPMDPQDAALVYSLLADMIRVSAGAKSA